MIFVYGTLMRGLGYPMHEELAACATFVGEGTLSGRLFSLGWYPGVIAGDGAVLGEVYDAADAEEGLLSLLDVYEGCAPSDPQPHEYRRIQRPVQLTESNDTVLAWVYEYQGSIDGRQLIPNGDFRAFTKNARNERLAE